MTTPTIPHENAEPWIVPATIVKVIDGETIRLDLDLGKHGAHRRAPIDLGWHIRIDPDGHIRLKQDVRIEGINAPETSTQAGKDAKSALSSMLAPGTAVELVSKEILGSTEKYGRVLGDVRIPKRPAGPLFDVAEWMLERGYAVPWSGEGPRP